ncbi:protein FAR1-RELATED SEQUENCE 5-like [Helianthus annuus]|uniref:protein FAR1-RELATED SEQUENCE 5-like n=1 Tax=Helianthus annuus TaxID=4232 RepID=UPI000B8F2585|nr:protein FAR1-RELATED SEQUENCE 5-like [Helianthus annuus]
MENDDQGFQTYQPVGKLQLSPNSGKKTYLPEVDESLKPRDKMTFATVNNAFLFYQKYAMASGFTARKSSQYTHQGVIKSKWFVCSKEGTKPFKTIDTSKKIDTSNHGSKRKSVRRVPSIRTGCKARMCIKLMPSNLYEVSSFIEAHNHFFVAEEDRHLLPSNRGMNHMQEQAVNALSALNIGPVKAFNIMRTLYGGFDKVGATKNDFKNFKRDLNRYISEFDADMMIKRLLRKKEYMPNFSMEYITDENGVLRGLFWADEDAKRNFSVFGDVVSFDATYRRNKYNMMFVPFTGIDNHNRNVTLGAAIIGNETAETYSWLLNVFRQAFGRAPPVIVTDQDPAMKKAIEDTWPESRHRLCMWHIMDKLSAKVGASVCNNTDFKKRLCAIVWTDSIIPDKFESEWATIMNDFNLVDHEWLQSIYQIRDTWIPAYYREEVMSGLMRTSSRSESENHFFGQFCNRGCTLVEFLGHFDSAIEAQRHEHRKNDHDTRNTNAEIFDEEFVLEDQASRIFTRTIFFDQQLEIQHGTHRCAIGKWEDIGDFVNFFVKDWEQPCTTFFEVMMREADMTVYCTCKRFEQFGLLCSHIFCVLRMLDIREFPQRYILRRWTREAVPNSTPGAILGINETEDRYNEVNRVVREITYSTESVINQLVTNFDALCSFRDHVVNYFKTADESVVNAPPKSRRDRFAEITGNTKPSEATVRVPIGTRFKGMGKPKRMKSKREIAVSQLGKKSRQCQNCFRYGHNRRSCKNPTRTKEQAMAEDDGEGADEGDEEEDEWEEVEEDMDEQDEDALDGEDGEEE